MKILVFSDSHGNASEMSRIVRKNKNAQVIVFCGDGHRDIEALQAQFPDKQYYCVKGNCDWYADFPALMTVTLCNKKFIITHGHCQYVKQGTHHLISLGHQEKADIILFGHTHKQLTTVEEGILIINPGSIGYNKEYTTIETDEKTGRITVREYPDEQYGPVIIN